MDGLATVAISLQRGWNDGLIFWLPAVGAERDALIPPTANQASATAWNAEYTIFPGRGHDIMLDTGWQEVAEHIIQWIKSNIKVE